MADAAVEVSPQKEEKEEQEEQYEEEEDEAEEAGGDDELEAMKRKLAEMEAEAERLKSGGAPAGDSGAAAAAAPAAPPPSAEQAAREEADARSVYVGNVDYAATPEELQLIFQGCGTVNRVTIPTDAGGNPKGFAYIEFLETDAVDNALLMDATEVRGRAIKVLRKRTNAPGLRPRGGGGGFRGGRGGRGPPRGGGGGGFAPRGRGGYRGRGRGRGFSPY